MLRYIRPAGGGLVAVSMGTAGAYFVAVITAGHRLPWWPYVLSGISAPAASPVSNITLTVGLRQEATGSHKEFPTPAEGEDSRMGQRQGKRCDARYWATAPGPLDHDRKIRR